MITKIDKEEAEKYKSLGQFQSQEDAIICSFLQACNNKNKEMLEFSKWCQETKSEITEENYKIFQESSQD